MELESSLQTEIELTAVRDLHCCNLLRFCNLIHIHNKVYFCNCCMALLFALIIEINVFNFQLHFYCMSYLLALALLLNVNC